MQGPRKLLKKHKERVLAALPALALGIFAVIWVIKTGTQIGPEAIVEETIARSPSDLLWKSWVKSDFSYSSSLPQHGAWLSPFQPLLRSALGTVGWEHWSRGNFIAISALVASPIVLAWAVSLPSWIAAFGVFVLLLAEPTQLLNEVVLGQSTSVVLAGFFVCVGFFVRKNPRALGISLGALVWVRWESFLLIPAFGLALLIQGLVQNRAKKKKRSEGLKKRLIGALLATALVILPLSALSLSHGGSFWGKEQTAGWIGGRAVATRWLSESDSGWADFQQERSLYDDYDQWTRKQWNSLISPWIGEFWIETLTMGFIIAIGFFTALKVAATRDLIVLAFSLMPILVSVAAAQKDLFDRRLYLPWDALLITVVMIVLNEIASKKRLKAWIAIGALWLTWVSWSGFARTLDVFFGQSNLTPWLSGPTPGQAIAIAELNQTRETLLAAPGQGRALAYFLRNQPIVELPMNWAQDGILDRLIERFEIRWTTIPGELLRQKSQAHQISIKSAANGQILYRIEKTAAVTPPPVPGL